MHDLTGFQRDLLNIIGGLDRPKGLTVKAELDDYYTDEITVGRLYPNINTLVDKGLVKKAPKMTAQEVETAVRNDIPILVVVMNDEALGT